MGKTIDALLSSCANALRPPPNLKMSEWADANRVLSPEASAQAGRWKTSFIPYVKDIMDTVNDPAVHTCVWQASAQVGKALDIDTPLPTPDGWVTMGEVKVGDTVYDEMGKPCRVIGATGMQKNRTCYNVKFSDGSEIVADADHRWAVRDDGGETQVKNTGQMAEAFNRSYFSIDAMRCLVYGVDIGIDVDSFVKELREYRLPPISTAILRASKQTRMLVYERIFGINLSPTETGTVHSCKNVIEFVHELVISLGLEARLLEGVCSYGYIVEVLHRKRTSLRILSIEPVKTRLVKCISVDSPNHLYLAGRSMIPTHNTELCLNAIGYYIDQSPAPLLCIQPTVEMAEAFSNDRVRTMIRDTKCLAERINLKKKGGGNTVLHKAFAGGHLTMVGANSPSALASRPMRVVIGDEIDRYDGSAGNEGDPVKLAEKRTTTFYNRFHFYCSTPGNAETSRIEPMYISGDQRQFHVPCFQCGGFQVLKFSQFRYDEDKTPESTYYECEHCQAHIEDKHKRAFLEGGYWKSQQPFKGIASFHVWEAYSPWVKFHQIVDGFLASKNHPEQRKVWVNTSLGETYTEKGDAPDWKVLYNRREEWDRNIIPAGALKLVAAIDVQHNRLEMEVKGLGRNGESWTIDYFTFEGVTADISSPTSPWREVEKIMDKTWQHALGGNISIAVTAVDSSDQTMLVYVWARRHGRRVMCIKGRQTAPALLSPPKQMDIRIDGKRTRKGIMLYTVGTDIGKMALYGRLKIEQPTDNDIAENGYPFGYLHFNDWQDEEYFKQMCAEQRIRKRNRKGYWMNEWHKLRDRNEVLDINNYILACFDRLGLGRMTEAHWEELEDSLGKNKLIETAKVSDTQSVPAVETVQKRVTVKRRKVNFMGG